MLIVLDQLLSVVGLLAVVALAGHAPNWTVPAVTVLYSLTRPFTQGSFFSALADIVGPELLDHGEHDRGHQPQPGRHRRARRWRARWSGSSARRETVELQAALTVVVAALVAVNPAFEARADDRPP